MACGYGAAVYSEGICLLILYNIIFFNILNSPQCSCGKQEDAYHFFFVCKNYSTARNTLFDCLFMLELVNIDLNLLLFGDLNLPLQINNRIFAAVHKYINESCRFA